MIVLLNKRLRRKYIPSPDREPGIDRSMMVGTGAKETDQPLVYEMNRPYQAKGLEVGISSRSVPEYTRWLKRDEVFTYDEELGLITFIDKNPVDAEKGEYIFVCGIPRQDIFLFKQEIPKGSVTVILNDAPLKEGDDFTVDYAKGIVRVKRAEINEKSARYKVSGPDKEFVDRVTDEKNQANIPRKKYNPSPDKDLNINPAKMADMFTFPTKNPKVFKVLRQCQTRGLEVAITDKTKMEDLKWIKRGRGL